MSIELDNPKSAVGKVDAAANLVAQLRIATALRDGPKIHELLNRTDKLLFDALGQMERECSNHQ